MVAVSRGNGAPGELQADGRAVPTWQTLTFVDIFGQDSARKTFCSSESEKVLVTLVSLLLLSVVSPSGRDGNRTNRQFFVPAGSRRKRASLRPMPQSRGRNSEYRRRR